MFKLKMMWWGVATTFEINKVQETTVQVKGYKEGKDMKEVCYSILLKDRSTDSKTVLASVCIHFCSLHLYICIGGEKIQKMKTCYILV